MPVGKRPAGALYILPNLFTASSIFVGVLSMVSAINGFYEKAAWLILLALLFDGLDGRVARLTNTCSKFGVEFDSLADIVAFGAATAILLYTYVGGDYGRYGVAVSALYVIFGAVRLARFNVMTVSYEPSVFIGVPIPTAAVFVAVLVLLFERYHTLHPQGYVILLFVLTVALLMVSNIRYPSFKKIDLKTMHMRRLLLIVVFIAILLFLFPIEGFALLFIGYILYGPIRALFSLSRIHRIKRK
jgi:CDP-diacylglycerol--serine O-phosphatidyltransferase